MIKIIRLTNSNVDALRKVFTGNDKITVTQTTAEFNMGREQALALVEDAMNDTGPGTVRHSLHAVRRKLRAAVTR